MRHTLIKLYRPAGEKWRKTKQNWHRYTSCKAISWFYVSVGDEKRKASITSLK